MIVWKPSRGVDFERESVTLSADFCSDAKNFLFERGVARTRPHALHTPGTDTLVDYEFGYLLEDRQFGVLSILNDGTVNGLTGAATSFGAKEFHNISYVAGNYLIGNNVGGLIHGTGSSYTINANAKYRYFAGSLSRSVAGYDITASSEQPRVFAWSTTSDPTDYTSTGAGSSELTGVADGITGIRSIGNVVVILRDGGITLAYLTGSSTSGPFRFENVIQNGVGCPWPSTVADHNNTVFFVGPDDVYAYQIRGNPEPIGRAVRDRLQYDLSVGEKFRGVVTWGDAKSDPGGNLKSLSGIDRRPFVPRARYHLVPVEGEGKAHYCLDIETGAWSVHTYRGSITAATAGSAGLAYALNDAHPVWGLRLHAKSLLGVSGFPNDWVDWVDGNPGVRSVGEEPEFNQDNASYGQVPDQEAYIVSPEFAIGGRDAKFDGGTIVWRAEAPTKDPPPLKITLEWKEKNNPKSDEKTISVGEIDQSLQWNRTKFSIRGNGGAFRIRITVPDGLKVALSEVQLDVEDFAETRGNAYGG